MPCLFFILTMAKVMIYFLSANTLPVFSHQPLLFYQKASSLAVCLSFCNDMKDIHCHIVFACLLMDSVWVNLGNVMSDVPKLGRGICVKLPCCSWARVMIVSRFLYSHLSRCYAPECYGDREVPLFLSRTAGCCGRSFMAVFCGALSPMAQLIYTDALFSRDGCSSSFHFIVSA